MEDNNGNKNNNPENKNNNGDDTADNLNNPDNNSNNPDNNSNDPDNNSNDPDNNSNNPDNNSNNPENKNNNGDDTDDNSNNPDNNSNNPDNNSNDPDNNSNNPDNNSNNPDNNNPGNNSGDNPSCSSQNFNSLGATSTCSDETADKFYENIQAFLEGSPEATYFIRLFFNQISQMEVLADFFQTYIALPNDLRQSIQDRFVDDADRIFPLRGTSTRFFESAIYTRLPYYLIEAFRSWSSTQDALGAIGFTPRPRALVPEEENMVLRVMELLRAAISSAGVLIRPGPCPTPPPRPPPGISSRPPPEQQARNSFYQGHRGQSVMEEREPIKLTSVQGAVKEANELLAIENAAKATALKYLRNTAQNDLVTFEKEQRPEESQQEEEKKKKKEPSMTPIHLQVIQEVSEEAEKAEEVVSTSSDEDGSRLSLVSVSPLEAETPPLDETVPLEAETLPLEAENLPLDETVPLEAETLPLEAENLPDPGRRKKTRRRWKKTKKTKNPRREPHDL